jgi:hypothetical protein
MRLGWMAALALSAPLCLIGIDNGASAGGWGRDTRAWGWDRRPYRLAYSYRRTRVYGYRPAYRSPWAYPPRLYSYGPVYGYGPPTSTMPDSAANKMAPIWGYGPGYAPEFGAGYYSPSVKMGSASWWR